MKKLLTGVMTAIKAYFMNDKYAYVEDYCYYEVEANAGADEVSLYYAGEIAKMIDILDTADWLIKDKIFDTAMSSIILGIQIGIKCITFHGLDTFYYNGFENDIKICQEHNLLPDDFIAYLHEVVRKCNSTAHSIEKNSSYDDAFFCYMVLKKLIDKIREFV